MFDIGQGGTFDETIVEKVDGKKDGSKDELIQYDSSNGPCKVVANSCPLLCTDDGIAVDHANVQKAIPKTRSWALRR